MRKLIIASIIIVSVAATFGVRHYTQASTFTATDADVDHDGWVSILDLAQVAHFYGQAAPLPVASPTPPTIIGNRAYTEDITTPPFPIELVNTDNGSIIAQFPGFNWPDSGTSSCDGRYTMMWKAATQSQFQVVDNATGTIVLSDATPYVNAAIPVFTCPLKGAGATFTGGGVRRPIGCSLTTAMRGVTVTFGFMTCPTMSCCSITAVEPMGEMSACAR